MPESLPEFAALLAAFAVTLLCARRIGLPLVASLAAGEALAFALIGNVTMPIAVAAVTAALGITRGGSLRTQGVAPFLRESVLILAGLAAYTLARRLIESDGVTALDHGRDVIAFERSMSLYVEADVQAAAMHSSVVVRLFNWFYSFGFLSCVVVSLIWLWASDSRAYRLLRNSLGVSVLPALALIALYPVAPPRLIGESSMVDTVVLFGREHAFVNEYAAVPSLHVGWMAIAGIAVALSMRSAARWLVAAAPGALMLVTVIVTGNHFWLDGAVGTACALTYPVATSRGVLAGMAVGARRAAVAVADLASVPRMMFTTIGMGGLLGYLIVMQMAKPGFTDFWWYLTGQVTVIGTLLLGAEVIFRKQGGLSATTHIIAVACCYADVLGTDGNLYANIDEYDKLTHFAGVAAITAGIYDGLRAMRRRGWLAWAPGERLAAAMLAGFAVGVGWEMYEFLGDKVFQTTRVQSTWDTTNDIVSDALGAMALGVMLWLGEVAALRQAPEAWDDERHASRRSASGRSV